MKLNYILLLFLVLIKATLYADSESLQKLINIALANNPQLQSMKNEYLSQEKEIMPAYFPPDPTISFNLMNIPVNTFSFDKSPMSSKQIAFKQMLPFPTKLIYKGKLAHRMAEIKESQYRLYKEKLILKIKIKYYTIVYLKNTLKIEEKKKSQLELFQSIAETKYKVGKGLQQDVLKAKVNLLQVEKKLIMLKTKYSSKLDELKKLLGIPEISSDIKFSFDNIRKLDKEKIITKALRNFPGIILRKRILHKSENKYSLSKWSYMPDIMLGAAYSSRNNGLPDGGVDFYTISVGLVFPLYFPFKQTPELLANKRKVESAKKSFKDMRNYVIEQINVHFKLYQQNKDIYTLLKDKIVKDAKLSLDSALKSYQVDKIDFLNVIQSLITLYNYYSELEFTRAEIEKQIAYLEFYSSEEKYEKK